MARLSVSWFSLCSHLMILSQPREASQQMRLFSYFFSQLCALWFPREQTDIHHD